MRIAAMVLAAGASRRFGVADKLLADAGDGVPLVVRVLRALDGPAIDDIVVVVRVGADELVRRVAAADLSRPVRFVETSGADPGLAGSVVAGLSRIPDGADGLLVTPADMPGLTRTTVDRLLAAYAADGAGRIAYAALPDGSQRHPVVWPPRLWPRLAQLSGDGGGKAVLGEDVARNGAVVVSADSSELSDIDTREDLARFVNGSC